MPFETPITIEEAIGNICTRKYLLPSIQREVVWGTDRMERLFDSLMRDYPIGSFLFWRVEKQKREEFQFYEFIKDYHERDRKHNPKASISRYDDVTAVLDGQQRLTALYIGLKGTYARKLPRRWRQSDSAFPEKELYVNLLKASDAEDMKYDFRFLTQTEAGHRDENTYWFKVGHILDIQKEYEVNEYLIQNGLLRTDEQKSIFANETLFKLHYVIHKAGSINFYLEKDQETDKVLNIFIRINSGGMILSYSDLLLSIATAQWREKDAREEITKFVDEINRVGDGFGFSKDFVLKSCLILGDFTKIAFKVDNFNRHNMLAIESKWAEIAEAIRLAVTLVSSFGYCSETLTSNSALIPIAYYLLNKGLPHNFVESSKYTDDRKAIHKWLILSLLRRAFSGQPDSVLRPIREIISDSPTCFPLQGIVDKFKGSPKTLAFDVDTIEKLLFYEYGESYTFSALALLYPTLDYRNKFHIDHIFPRSFFTKKKLSQKEIQESKVEYYIENSDYLPNLQLLEGIPNQEKGDMDFGEWLNKSYPDGQDRQDYMMKHYIPDIDLGFGNFENFVREREKLMRDKFTTILKL